MTMRITHVFKIYPPDSHGGIEQVIHTLCEHGQRLGIENRVLVLSPRGYSRERHQAGYEIVRYKRDMVLASSGFSLQFMRRFAADSKGADLLHFHYPWPGADLAYIASRSKIPALITYHSDIVSQKHLERIYAPLRNRFLAKMQTIVATSPNYAESSLVLRRWQDRLRVIPIGNGPHPHPDTPALPGLQNAPWQQGRYFAFVGVLRYYKGLHNLVAALQNRDYPTVIMGDGPEKPHLQRLAKQFGLRNLHFLGVVDEATKHAVLSRAYGFVFPSNRRSEAFGISLLEAGEHGVPMISCEIGTGTSYANLHEVSGLVVPPDSPEALGQALDRFWQQPDEVAQWGHQARQRFQEQFTSSLMADRYAALYRELLSKQAVQG